MKETLKAITGLMAIVTLLALSLQINGCKPQETPSLYDPNWKGSPTPVVDSLAPGDSALAGIDQITIYGKNFSQNPQADVVFFNSTIVPIIGATTTQLVMKAPPFYSDTIQVRVSVIGAEFFSNTFNYKLFPAVAPFGKLQSYEAAGGIATDTSGNVYVSIASNLSDEGLSEFLYHGARKLLPGTKTPGVSLWTSLKVGPGGYIYAARNVRAIYRFAPSLSTPAAQWAGFPFGVFINDIDFDQNGNLWGGGNNKNIYCVLPTATVKAFPFVGIVHSVRVYNGSLYFSARTDSMEQIWKAPIIGDSLGTPSVYFNFSRVFGANGPSAFAITFSSAGDLYIGTDAPGAIVIVHPNLSYETPYAALLQDIPTAFAWGKDGYLYATTKRGSLYRIYIRMNGAPYYGAK